MEERELPVGWAEVPLGELSEIIRGITFPASAKESAKSVSNVCCLRTSNVQAELIWNDIFYVDRTFVKRPDQLVRVGDILMSMANSYELVGKVSVAREVPREAAFGAFLAAIRPLAVSDGRYLFYFLRSESVQRQIRSGSSQTTNIANISAGKLREIIAPVAPLNEQRRIAAKLDTTLAAIEACRQRLDSVAAILKRFRQAVLAAATSGKLTREWREENPDEVDASSLAAFLSSSHSLVGGHKQGNGAPPTDGVHDLSETQFPEGWGLVELRDIVRPDRPITYGILKPGPEMVEGVPYVRVADFPGDKLRIDGIRKTSFEIDEAYKRSRLEAGDLLLLIRGTVGRLILIPPELEGSNITQDSARLSIQDVLPCSYIKYALHSELLQSRMRRAVKGVAVRGINIGDVRALQVPLPSIHEQEEIVKKLDSLFTLADQLEARLNAARKIVDRLSPALLAKAFRGELVPQDPTDEPASVLLERIRAARQVEAGAGKSSRRGRPKAAANPAQMNRNAAPAPSEPLPPDLLSQLLRECGALSERALLAASELEPEGFFTQLERELRLGSIRQSREEGQLLLEAVA